jgi:hypothetical protein
MRISRLQIAGVLLVVALSVGGFGDHVLAGEDTREECVRRSSETGCEPGETYRGTFGPKDKYPSGTQDKCCKQVSPGKPANSDDQ